MKKEEQNEAGYTEIVTKREGFGFVLSVYTGL